MPNYLERLRYWLAKPYIDDYAMEKAQKYIDDHIQITQCQKVISDMELMSTEPSYRNNLTAAYFREILREMLTELVNIGAIEWERKKESSFGGETIKARIRWFKK